VAGFARVQWAVTIGLTPILWSAFGGISLVSVLANAIAVPLFTVIVVPLVLVGTLAAAVSISAGSFVLSLPIRALELSWPLFERLGALDGGYWFLPQLPIPGLLVLSGGVALLVLPGILATRIAGALLCMPVLLYRPAPPAQGTFELAVLDVGQGLAVVVQTAGHALVYDAGPAFRNGRDAGEWAVLPYLHARGIRALDELVISHDDLDHRGGARSLAAGMSVTRVLAGPSVREGLTERCARGQHWVWDAVAFEVLHPTAGASSSDNESSCVLRISSPAGSALLTGDIQAEGEAALVRAGVPRTDVVVVPHHGSRTSSGAALVASLGASHALISAGYRNRWNLPSEEVIERWRAGGARTYVTADSGAIELSFSNDGPLVREYRREHPKYWRRMPPARGWPWADGG
jgi:competence protein ComEC